MVNVPVSERVPLDELAILQAAIRRVEAELGDRGRVLIRYSGTELKARVMVEGENESRVRELAADLADVLKRARD
jgi:phosphoglucosamine mutase